jgi:hypothetical protein
MSAHRPLALALLFILLLLPTDSLAQETLRVGISISAPSSVGLFWQASEKVAIRPEFSFSTSDVSSDESITQSNGSNYNLSVAGLFYLHKWDELRAYVSPRFSYTHATTDLTSQSGTQLVSSSSDIYGFSGSFGAQYMLGRRFAVFGETGLSFAHQNSETESTVSVGDTNVDTFSVRNAVGVVFYF